jgi:nucleoside-diphosphate-sugar epimerase
METIVITGASGFIGSSIYMMLKKNENFNLILVSKTKSKKPFTQVNDFGEVPSGDILIHLSENSDRNQVNSLGDISFEQSSKNLDLLLKKKYKKIIYFSSSTVYGDCGSVPYDEKSKTLYTDSYSKLKLSNEKKVIGRNGIVLRVTNVIGPNMSNNNVYSDIISQLGEGESVVVRNDKPIRDFIWHEDVAYAVVKILSSNCTGIYNVGSGIGTSIRHLVKTILKLSESDKTIVSLDKCNLNSYNVVNIEKLRSAVNWTPKHSIEKIINLMESNK